LNKNLNPIPALLIKFKEL